MRGSDIRQMIKDGELEISEATITCPNCESEVSLYEYKYDSAMNAFFCDQCTYSDWADDAPSRDNPRRCPSCGDFVTDQDVDAGRSVQCNAVDTHDDRSCEQLAHKSCVDSCRKCGWFCGSEETSYSRCDSCGLLHNNDDFVSGGKEFVEYFGDICWSCWSEDSDRFQTPDEDVPEEPEEAIEARGSDFRGKIGDALQQAKTAFIGLVSNIAEPDRKRRDSSKYLSHFVRKRPGMTVKECSEQLITILRDKKLKAKPTGYFSTYQKDKNRSAASKAVCFTEGRLTALHDHAKEYSPFGVAFSKFALLKNAKAAPVIHIHEDLINQTRGSIPLEIVPYVNLIAPDRYNYQHEREWRVPQDLHFKFEEVAFIFAPHGYHAEIEAITGGKVRLFCIDTVMEI